MRITIPDCRYFSGSKPCPTGRVCWNCVERFPRGKKILLIQLSGQSHTLLMTSQLRALHLTYPESTLYWITLPENLPLLENNPYVDFVIPWCDETKMIVENMSFDVALNPDIHPFGSALMMNVQADKKAGFGLNEDGAVVPFNKGAHYQYFITMDNDYRRKQNERTLPMIINDSMELAYEHDRYLLNLNDDELDYCDALLSDYDIYEDDITIGIISATDPQWPQRLLQTEQYVELIRRIAKKLPDTKILLLSQPDGYHFCNEIIEQCGDIVIPLFEEKRIREYLCYLNLADIVVSGDTFGMHAAIGLKKWVVAWLGQTQAQETELFDRGQKVESDAFCAGCNNRTCEESDCIDHLDMDRLFEAVEHAYEGMKNGTIERDIS